VDTLQIRSAVEEGDLPDLVRIYNHFVETTPITFETEPFSVEDRRDWFESFATTGPYRLFIAEIDSRAVGYASSQEFHKKPAYRTSVETSIYLDAEYTGRGIGRSLYETLLEALKEEEGVHRAYGGITLPNPASVALHQHFGFKLAGTFREVGYKLGRYWDVAWYEKDV